MRPVNAPPSMTRHPHAAPAAWAPSRCSACAQLSAMQYPLKPSTHADVTAHAAKVRSCCAACMHPPSRSWFSARFNAASLSRPAHSSKKLAR